MATRPPLLPFGSAQRQHALVFLIVLMLHALAALGLILAQAPAGAVAPSVLQVSLLSPERTHETPTRAVQMRALLQIPVPIVSINLPAIATPVLTTTDPSPAPIASAPVAAEAAPESLKTELAVLCPGRAAPAYPLQAKRLREQGEVRLRVELDERGQIESVTVLSTSGSRRLDEAARAAVQSWRCNPAQREGRSVRAVALQTLAFELHRP